MITPRCAPRFRAAALVAALVVLTGCASEPAPDRADDEPHERGPAPTVAALEAEAGPYEVTSEAIPAQDDFGGGTLFYPAGTDETFGAVAISPGFRSLEASVAWLGPRIASHGFVVVTIETLKLDDQPPTRGDQLLAALEHVVDEGPAGDLVDDDRLAVMGHSMGGGGALEAAATDPSLQAAIPLAGFSFDRSWPELETPTLFISAENDTVASSTGQSLRMYESLDPELGSAFLELAGADHGAPTLPDTTIAMYSVAWLKRYVDNDTRYEQFLCPGPTADERVSDYRAACES